LCSLVDFYPAHTQLRWFQGQQELSVVANNVVPNGDWTHQILVLLETSPLSARAHIHLPGRTRQTGAPPELALAPPRDAAGCCRSKMLTGTGDSELGFVFLALGIGFYLRKNVWGVP
uniref:LOW QUALITY PROTEIN: class II histocompatibility antigen, B-L beta chain-like n=1 Tax=Lonchura striata TaxID=40157 RepID=UPI001293B418